MHHVVPPSGTAAYRGVFPVVPTTFAVSGPLDLPSQCRCIDFMIAAGAPGLCILANFSEQFSLTDHERQNLASCIFDYFAPLSDATDIPIMVQDAPFSGTALSVTLLARMAKEIEQLRYFKITCAGATNELRHLIALGGAAIEGPLDGEEAITLLADLDAGATGSITGGGYPDGVRAIFDTKNFDSPSNRNNE